MAIQGGAIFQADPIVRQKENGDYEVISIDTKGKNLIEENKAVFNAKKKPILERINAQIRFIK